MADPGKTSNDLEALFARVRALPAADKGHIRQNLSLMLEAVADAEEFRRDMKDSDYFAYVMEGVDAGLADVAAGRVHPVEAVIAEFEGRRATEDE